MAWSCVGRLYVAFLFVPTAANPSLSFHFPSFNMELFLALSWLFYLSHSLYIPHPSLSPLPPSSNIWSGEKAVLLQTQFFILLLPVSAARYARSILFLRRAFSLSFFLSPSFHLSQGAFDVIIGCSACDCT